MYALVKDNSRGSIKKIANADRLRDKIYARRHILHIVFPSNFHNHAWRCLSYQVALHLLFIFNLAQLRLICLSDFIFLFQQAVAFLQQSSADLFLLKEAIKVHFSIFLDGDESAALILAGVLWFEHWWPKGCDIFASSSIFELDSLFKDVREGLLGELCFFLQMYFIDLIFSHGLLCHAEEELDGGRTVDEVAVMQPAPEVPGEEGDDVDDGASEGEHANLAQIHNSDPGLHLSLQHAVLQHISEEISSYFVESFLFQVQLDYAANVDNDYRSIVYISPHQIEQSFLLQSEMKYQDVLDLRPESKRQNGVFPFFVLLQLLGAIVNVEFSGLEESEECWVGQEGEMTVSPFRAQLFMKFLQFFLFEGSVGDFSLEDDAVDLLVPHLVDLLVLGEEEEGLARDQWVLSDHIPNVIIQGVHKCYPNQQSTAILQTDAASRRIPSAQQFESIYMQSSQQKRYVINGSRVNPASSSVFAPSSPTNPHPPFSNPRDAYLQEQNKRQSPPRQSQSNPRNSDYPVKTIVLSNVEERKKALQKYKYINQLARMQYEDKEEEVYSKYTRVSKQTVMKKIKARNQIAEFEDEDEDENEWFDELMQFKFGKDRNSNFHFEKEE